MKKIISALVALAALAAVVATPSGVAGAQDIVIDTGGAATGAPGSRLLIDEVAVDPALVGGTCTGTVTAANNASVHPNNDLVLTSAGVEYVIADVEAGPDDVSTQTGSAVVGDTIRVELVFGPNGVTSGGLQISLSCVPPAAQPAEPTPAEPALTG